MDKNSILNSVKKDFFLFPATVVQDLKMIYFCQSPYERHPIGCPNWDHKPGCPPHTKPFLSLYDAEVYVAIARMDYGTYLSLKKELHPDWTERALRNPRHWQGHLRSEIKKYLTPEKIPAGYQIVTNAEAMGINLFETCANAGFVLERDPQNFVCHVNLLVKPNHP
ncbi:MAG: hypothetical protein ACD_61C00056G0007 [uncultured bacterium]|nr:MAG: hypothetical protein ACD_61C00056G0007 [uncultured bacterium]